MRDQQIDEALDELLDYLKHHLSSQPEVLAEASVLLNSFIFHAFSDIRNDAIEQVRRKLTPKGKEMLKNRQPAIEVPA